jgi:HNH endonuclease/Methylase-associated X1
VPQIPHGRAATAALLVELLGDAAAVRDLDEGWPARLLLQLPTEGAIRLSAYVGPVHSMARGRRGELRFQNPGSGHPVLEVEGEVPLLLGLDVRPPPVLVVPETTRRLGHETRFSVRFPDSLLFEARATGWATPYVSTSEEVFHAFHPTLLPAFVELATAGIEIDPSAMADEVTASDVLVDDTPANRERARRYASALVRDQKFSPAVLAAYGYRCAMCGLGLGLTVAAHILPAATPGSPDSVINGLALCPTHHAAFDRHLIYVSPADLSIKLHPTLAISADPADRAFRDVTAPRLRAPADPRARPSAEMLEARYETVAAMYEWVQTPDPD